MGIAIVCAIAFVCAVHLITRASIERVHFQVSRDVKVAEMERTKLTDEHASRLHERIEELDAKVKAVRGQDIARKLGG